MLEKMIQIGQLFAIYKPLLTKKQQEMLSLYYEEDFSLSEIADHYQITRQGVHDNINRGEKALIDYEASLHLNQRRLQRLELYQEIKAINENKEITGIIAELIQLDD